MQDCYRQLGISEGATPAIVTIAFEGRLKALRESQVPEPQRQAEERLLERAYAVLSHPAKRAWYDRQRNQDHAKRTRERGWLWTAAAALVAFTIVGAGAWHAVEGSKERERAWAAQQRLWAEQEALRVAKEEWRASMREARESREASMAAQRERDMRYQLERGRDYRDYGYASSQFNYASRVDSSRIIADDRLQRYAEERERREEAANRRQAQADVDRQMRWVADREAEEARIRADKHYRAQAEAAAIAVREANERRRTSYR